MGIIHPRPAMRSAEGRRIMARLKRHTGLMLKYEAEGMSREDASAEAYAELCRLERNERLLSGFRKR